LKDRKINIKKNHRNKTMHFLMEIINNLIEGLVDTSVFMSAMLVAILQKLGIMHLVSGLESYKIVSSVITQAHGKINELLVQVGDV
jgi:hypothetical protein